MTVFYQYDALNRLTKESYTGPKASGCIELGSSDFVTIDTDGDLAASRSKMTVDMRIRLDAYPTGGNEAILFERGTDGGENWFKLYIDSTGFLRVRVESDHSEKSRGVGTVPLGKWVHVAGYFDGIEEDLGVSIDGVSSSVHHQGTLDAFTGDPKLGHGVFAGKIDEVHVRSGANYALDPTEDYTPGSDTLGLWHFDEGTGTRSVNDDLSETRYIRVWSQDVGESVTNPGIFNLQILEMYAYDEEGTNVASGKSATARSEHFSGNYPASKVTDGSLVIGANQGMYAAYYDGDCCNLPEWVYVDLGSGERIKTAAVQWRNDGNMEEPNSWKLQKSDNGTSWTDVKSFSSYSYPTGYLETVDVTQNATVPSGAWSTNDGEFGVGSYAREYAYDKVGNRTEMRLYDEDGNFSRDIEWTLEYNDLNQLTKRFVGASWSVGTHRIEYDYDDNGNLIGSVEETYSGGWSVSEEWQYDWNPRDQMTRAMKVAGSSALTIAVASIATL